MALTNTVPFLQTAKITPAAWVNADSANTKKTICTAGANGTKVVGLLLTSTDSSARIAQIWLTRSATSYLLGSVTVPVTAGSDGVTAAVNALDPTMIPGLPVDNDGQSYLFLQSGDTLQVSFTTQVTAAKEIDAVGVSADF